MINNQAAVPTGEVVLQEMEVLWGTAVRLPNQKGPDFSERRIANCVCLFGFDFVLSLHFTAILTTKAGPIIDYLMLMQVPRWCA